MKLATLEARIAERDTLMPGVLRDERLVTDARWSVREAQRLIDAATGLDEVCEEMEKADTLPLPPESGARRMG